MAFCHLCLYSLYCSSVILAAFKADSKSKPMFETKLSTISIAFLGFLLQFQ